MNIIEAKNKTLTILATLNDIENGMTETAACAKNRISIQDFKRWLSSISKKET